MAQAIPYIATAFASFLPIENELLKYQIGTIISDLLRSLYDSKHWNIFKRCFRKNKVIVFNKNEEEQGNQIYFKLEEYIVKKFVTDIKSCELVPKKGEITFSIYDEFRSSRFIEQYEGHMISIEFDMLKDAKNDTHRRALVFSSKTANLDIIKEYVKSICKFKILAKKVPDIDPERENKQRQ